MVKELGLAGISDMDASNAFRPVFTKRDSAKFGKVPYHAGKLHRIMNIAPDWSRDVFFSKLVAGWQEARVFRRAQADHPD
ncbi:MAG: hypothetical protein ABJQ70_00455 [Roseobacter sp.]